MRRMFLAGLLVCLSSFLNARTLIIPPVERHQASFAIIVDDDTYRNCADALVAYRDAVEKDGLSVYIVSGRWDTPSEVREEILSLKTKEKYFEGVVLAGDIPIAMIRNAEHLTSSDKLNNTYKTYFNTSVASDRFYDDFDLKFKYIKKDSSEKLVHYYSLLPESPQRVEKDIYSARIKAPYDNKNKYALISSFLLKAARVKSQLNSLDHAMVYTGYGYHSESLTSWSDEQLALREELPQLFTRGGRLKKLNFNMRGDIKQYLLRELQQPETDMAIFHAHGELDIQQLTDYPAARTTSEQIEAVRFFLREKLRDASLEGEKIENTITRLVREYSVPESWFNGTFNDSIIVRDEYIKMDMNITADDIDAISPAARFIVFDQCYNGSFHREGYLAGAYLFNDKGSTVSAVANSATVLQDQWADEYLGVLSYGARAGQWHKMNNLLESNLFGDPTFRFTPQAGRDISLQMTILQENPEQWSQVLSESEHTNNTALKAIAHYHMFHIYREKYQDKLVELYKTEDSHILRLLALRFLAELNGPAFEEILGESINDPFEYIRRMSAVWMGKVGRREYLPLMAKALLYDESDRVIFDLKRSIVLIDPQQAYEECLRLIDEMPLSKDKKNEMRESYRLSILNSQKWLNDELLANIKSNKLRLNHRVNEIENFKIYNFIQALPELLRIASDKKQESQMRVAVLEALGYYSFAYNRHMIIETCDQILSDSAAPRDVKDEALRTKKRITEGFNNPLTS